MKSKFWLFICVLAISGTSCADKSLPYGMTCRIDDYKFGDTFLLEAYKAPGEKFKHEMKINNFYFEENKLGFELNFSILEEHHKFFFIRLNQKSSYVYFDHFSNGIIDSNIEYSQPFTFDLIEFEATNSFCKIFFTCFNINYEPVKNEHINIFLSYTYKHLNYLNIRAKLNP